MRLIPWSGVPCVEQLSARVANVGAVPEPWKFQSHMKLLFLVAVAVLFTEVVRAQESVDLSKGWRFRPGDDPGWSDAELDDSSWSEIAVGKSWEKQGHSGLDGYAWYRLRLLVPEDLRETKDFSITRALVLELGQIDDVDQTWWNGELIGESGSFPPEYETGWRSERLYSIAPSQVFWGDQNIIAVRVFDGGGAGGMWSGESLLRCKQLADLVEMDWIAGDASRPEHVSAWLENSSGLDLMGEMTFKARSDSGVEIETLVPKRAYPAGARVLLESALPLSMPGFYHTSGTLRWRANELAWENDEVLAYRADAIESALTRESDFDGFWEQTLAQLAEIQPRYDVSHRPELDTPTHKAYLVTMYSLGDVRVRGWYQEYRKENPGALPAVLRLPGYSASMSPVKSTAALNYFSFNPRGHGNSTDDVPSQPEDYWIRGLDDKQGYFYRGAFADCIRAVDFLATRSEVDISKVAVTGGSQGGGLSLATAGLDSRVSLCAPDIPWLCDWKRYFELTNWPEMDSWIAGSSERTWESTLKTLSYFDVLNLAERIECPVLVGLGLEDGVCPPATIHAVTNRIPGPTTVHSYHSEHWLPASHQTLKESWILEHFEGK